MGGHRLDHTIEWTLEPDGSELTYTVDVPHALTEADLVDPLRRGLVLSQHGATLPLTVTDSQQRALGSATRVTLHARATHPPGPLRLSNGNLLDATSRTVLRLDVHHDLNLVRVPAPVQATSPLARTVEIETEQAAWWERLHRWAALPGRYQRHPIASADFSRNQTRPLSALGITAVLCLLAAVPSSGRLTRTVQRALIVAVAILASLWTTPWVWAPVGVGLAVVSLRHRVLLPLAAIAIAGSASLTGVPLLVGLVALLGRGRAHVPRLQTIGSVGMLVAAGLQMARVAGS